MKNRILSVVLALCLVFSLLPVTAFADTTASGTCGENLTWTLDSDNTLTISGSGDMEDYVDYKPWGDYYRVISSVVIEPGVTSIGDSAFYYCSSMQSVTIPESVTSIGSFAFAQCRGLKNITIPEGVTKIGAGAFIRCNEMESITLPSSVKSIGAEAFHYCFALKEITIPEGVTSIEEETFSSCDALQSITIPESVTSIGDRAFFGCELESITFPGAVQKIGNDAFYACENLKSIDISENSPSYCSVNGVLFDKNQTCLILYPKAKSETSYTVPDSVKAIGDNAFYGCMALNEIIMTGVQTIGKSAFNYCQNLKSVTIPNSVTSIGNWAFYDCGLEKLTLSNSMTSIGYSTFRGCEDLAVVSIPASIKEIGNCAFDYCKSLKDVYYSGSSAQWKLIEIDEVGNDALINAKLHCSPIGVPTIKITTSSGKPKISWSKISGATKYKIYRSTDGKTYKYLTYTTKTSYTNTKATIGTKYYYKVTAVNAGGKESDFSNIKSIKCVPATPALTISRVNGKPKLSWKAVDGATKYYIYRSTDGKTYKYLTYTTKTSYTNTNVKVGTKYYYKVKAVAVVNKTNVGSAYSAAKSFLVSTAAPVVKITTSNGDPKISWSKVDGASKYYIYRSTDGKNFKYYVATTKTAYTDTKAKAGTKYYYKVKAIATVNNTNVASAYSNAVSIKAK